MVDLKMFLISILAAALLSGAVIGTVIWKNRTNHYSLIISEEHLAHSTFLKDINSGDCLGAEQEFNKWVYAGGRRWKGLVSRRSAESQEYGKWCTE